jgi:hypothetical protein
MSDPAWWYHAQAQEPVYFFARLFLCGFLLGLLGVLALMWTISLTASYGTLVLDAWYDKRKNSKSTRDVSSWEEKKSSPNSNNRNKGHDEACARRGSRWLAGML